MSGQYPWGPPYTPAQQAWLQQQAYASQAHAQPYPGSQGIQASVDPVAAQSYAAMQHNMIMHQRSVALSNANAAVQAAQQRNQYVPASYAAPSLPHPVPAARQSDSAGQKPRGQKRPRDMPASRSGPVKVPQNLLQLVPSKYRYAFNVGDSQEDIEKWRAARRRRYPSAANRAVAEQQEASKLQRGEVAAQPNTGNMRSKQSSHSSAAPTPQAAAAAAPLPMTGGLVDYSSDSDDEAAPEEKASTAQAQLQPSMGLVPAAASSTAAAEAEPQSQAPVAATAPLEPASAQPAKRGKHDKSKQGGRRSGIVRGGEHLTASAVGSRAGTQRDASRGQRTQHRRGRQQRTSLLRQLLAGEMRKENSSILQCIRYLRQNDFLADVPLHGAAPEAGKSSESSDSGTTSDSSSDESSSDAEQ